MLSCLVHEMWHFISLISSWTWYAWPVALVQVAVQEVLMAVVAVL